jgi:ABC-type sugar transport system substrate-binding protein
MIWNISRRTFVIGAGAGAALGVTGSLRAFAADLPKLAKKSTYKVGFSQSESNPWKAAENDSIKEEAAKLKFTLIYTDAAGSAANQVSDVNSLIAQRVDVLFIAPREEKPLIPAVKAAKRAGIPVILLDRTVDPNLAKAGTDFLTFIGSDFIEEGKRCADFLLAHKPNGAKIIEIEGTTGSSPANDRKKGFDGALEGKTGFRILASQSGDFSRDKGRQVAETLLQAHPDVEVIYSQSDEMTMGALSAIQAAGKVPGKDIMVVGCDGGKEVVQQVVDGKVAFVVECNPRMGPKAFEVLQRYAAGEPIEAWVKNPDRAYDASNAAADVGKAW